MVLFSAEWQYLFITFHQALRVTWIAHFQLTLPHRVVVTIKRAEEQCGLPRVP